MIPFGLSLQICGVGDIIRVQLQAVKVKKRADDVDPEGVADYAIQEGGFIGGIEGYRTYFQV